jgi:CAP12/Pycsar effector protein, TIR domain
MQSYKLFIASSSPARNTAQFLWSELQNVAKNYQLELQPESWWEETFSPGVNTLDALITKSGTVDFAVILLTPDDLAHKDEYELLIPRDNCIYEAGLFTGSLGPDPKRCFLLTAIDKRALPTDLLGLTIVPIPHSPPGPLTDTAKRGIRQAAGTVVEQIVASGPFRRALIPLVPGTDLIEWERFEGTGHLRRNSHVIVRAEQPLELDDPDFAARVHQNMKGGVRYQYFFYADRDAANIMAELIQALAAAGVEEKGTDDLIEKLASNSERVTKNLETVGKFMAIYLLRHKPSFQMCIHNAEWLTKAKCYVRYPQTGEPRFILWSEGAEAKRLSEGLKRLRKPAQTGQKKTGIFRASNEFDLAEKEEYKSSLQSAIEELFPDDLRGDVVRHCFGEN